MQSFYFSPISILFIRDRLFVYLYIRTQRIHIIMNKIIVSLLFLIILIGCQQANNKAMQTQIDSLQLQLKKTYKPGFGEFMSSIQIHHEKLWFAGINENWKLADFEINEIKETLDDIQDYCTDRPETKSIAMINLPIDSISHTIQQKNTMQFKNAFIFLTNTCNTCHQATAHEFNKIKIPETVSFSNQEFKLK